MKITPVEPILVHMLQASMVRSAPQPAAIGHHRAKKHEKEQAAANQRAPAQQTSR